MSEQTEDICSNCHNFFPDSFNLTDLGICLADPAFEPYLDELLDKGNFAVCQDLIAAKRFPDSRQACPEYDEIDLPEVDDDFAEEMIEHLETHRGRTKPKSPEYSFRDHSFAWLLEHDGRLREFREIFQRYTAKDRRMVADYEYHAGPARELFDQLIERQQEAHELPAEVVALAIDPEFAPALLTVGTHEYILGRVGEAMALLLALVRLPRDTEDLFIIIDKAGDFLVARKDYANAVNLFEAAAASFPDEPMLQESLAYCKGK